ncbi:MAG: hypothetical protein JO250_10955 [Armatimonadetes bacterium]|nr:hypothetical protein [Armatimonadota bacterium]
MAEAIQERQGTDQVYEWLRAEAAARGVPATIYSLAAKQEGRFLIVPVHLAGMSDAFDFAAALQDLEDAYNNQQPKPDWLLILRPAAAPRNG